MQGHYHDGSLTPKLGHRQHVVGLHVLKTGLTVQRNAKQCIWVAQYWYASW